MKLIHVQDDVELVVNTNYWLKQNLLSSKKKVVLLPAGGTPIAIYRNWESEHPDFLNNIQFQQIDDILTGPKAGYFKTFFEQHLPFYSDQMIPLADEPLTPTVAILGVGLNGHLAFHEPEINFNFNYGCVKLSDVSCQSLALDQATWGLSYGLAHFMKCPAVLVIAKGQNKKDIVEKSLTEAVPSSPFSYLLKKHPHCTLILDQLDPTVSA